MADWIRNSKIVIALGLSLMGFATILLLCSQGLENRLFLLSLALLVLGAGFIRSNIPVLIANYQKDSDTDLFTEFYIYINMGSFIGVICCGLIAEIYGWHIGFILAACANLVALFFSLQLPPQKETLLAQNKSILSAKVCNFIFLLLYGVRMLKEARIFHALSSIIIRPGSQGFQPLAHK